MMNVRGLLLRLPQPTLDHLFQPTSISKQDLFVDAQYLIAVLPLLFDRSGDSIATAIVQLTTLAEEHPDSTKIEYDLALAKNTLNGSNVRTIHSRD